MPVHNHGPEEGKGLSCKETLVNGKLFGECLTDDPIKEKPYYFNPWISDEEPKAPEGWGTGYWRAPVKNPYTCTSCKEPITAGQFYIYSFKAGTPVELMHNTEECVASLIN